MANIRIDHKLMKETFFKILFKYGFHEEKAELIANIFTESSIDGVYSHGVNRFKRFIIDTENRIIKKDNEPEIKHSFNGMEQWDGNAGPGPWNATICCNRAMELANNYGIGCVALSNTTHWMRGGTYGWQAAKKGFVLIAWTNTIAIMPTWGATDCKLGNNPFVFAAPYNNEALVLDMAMSQFSYGLMRNYRLENKKLPLSGGYSRNGELTDDPDEILRSMRPLPMGYWKGAGMALLLDVLSTILSGGFSTKEITERGNEHGCSQVFIAIDALKLGNHGIINQTIDSIINDYLESASENDSQVIYPGKRVLDNRVQNLKNGIPVNTDLWSKILAL